MLTTRSYPAPAPRIRFALESLEEVRLDDPHPSLEPVQGHVAPGHFERTRRRVDRVHPRVGEGMGACHRDASAPGPEVEDAPQPTAVDPGMEAFLDELRERRPGHQHAPVDLEPEPREPRFPGEIGGGDPLLDSPVEQGDDLGPFTAGEAGGGRARRGAAGGPEGAGRGGRGRGLVHRVVGPVREAEPGLVEPARPEAHEVRDRPQALPAERPLRPPLSRRRRVAESPPLSDSPARAWNMSFSRRTNPAGSSSWPPSLSRA